MPKLLVAIDGSDYGVTAARAAVELAQCCFRDVVLVHVVSLKPGQLGTLDYPDRPDLPERWAVFQEPLAIAREAGATVRCEVLFGHAAEQILRYARRNDVDMIVMGSVGASGIREFLLGSVAARVVENAPCSVLIVRPGLRLSREP